jgi:hypothetical protein
MNNLLRTLFSVLLFSPIFISYGSNGLGFDRVGGFSHGSYFLSLPISFFLSLALMLRWWPILIKNKFVVLFLSYSILIILLNVLYVSSINYSLAKILTWMNFFIIMLALFQKLFENIFVKFSDKGINFNSMEDRLIYYPLMFVLISTVVSYFYFGKYSFVFDGVKIYNFEQYYTFIFILLLGISFKNKLSTLLFIFPLIIFITVISANSTAYILLFCLLPLILLGLHRYKEIYKGIVFCLAVFFILWPFLLYLSFNEFDVLQNSRSLMYRYSMVDGYFSTMKWFQIIFPFLKESRTIYADMHNELLEVFNATGILGIIFYYYFVLKRLANYSFRYRMVGLSITLVIFLGGTTVENTLHPYLLIVLAYVTSFYYVLSHFDRVKQKLVLQSVRFH